MKRISDRKARNAYYRGLKLDRLQKYTTAWNGYAARIKFYRQALGF